TRRVLEFDLLLKGETRLSADGVRGAVINRWKGVNEPILPFRARPLHNGGDCLRGDALALELWEHAPAGLPDVLASPLPIPVPDRSGRDPRGPNNDHEHAGLVGLAALAVALMTFADLLRSLRPTEVNGHGGIAHQSFEKRQVTVRPWSNVDI